MAAAAMLALPTAAQAGRLLVTGHDADQHCALEGGGSCQYMSTAVNYVKGGAPDPAKPLLVLDRGNLDVPAALKKAYPGAVPPHQVVDPRSPEFASLSLNTGAFSAIIVASSKDEPTDVTPADLNENDGTTPDTDAINARGADIEAFFNAGGGLFVNSGGQAGRTDSARYYRFIRITRGGRVVKPTFSLTTTGRALGFQDAGQFPGEANSINCCLTHLSFEAPAPEGPLKVAELDRAGSAITMIAETNRLAEVDEPAVNPTPVFAGVTGSGTAGTSGGTATGGGGTSKKSVCVPKSGRLRVSLKRPRGVRFARVIVYVNGKAKRRVTGRYLGIKSRTRAFTLRVSKVRTSKVRIVAVTATGRRLTFRQTYRGC